MAITFNESIKVLQTKQEGDDKWYKVKLTGTRIDSEQDSPIVTSGIKWIKAKADLTSLAVEVGNKIKAQISPETTTQALIDVCKGDFHTYLSERSDIQ